MATGAPPIILTPTSTGPEPRRGFVGSVDWLTDEPTVRRSWEGGQYRVLPSATEVATATIPDDGDPKDRVVTSPQFIDAVAFSRYFVRRFSAGEVPDLAAAEERALAEFDATEEVEVTAKFLAAATAGSLVVDMTPPTAGSVTMMLAMLERSGPMITAGHGGYILLPTTASPYVGSILTASGTTPGGTPVIFSPGAVPSSEHVDLTVAPTQLTGYWVPQPFGVQDRVVIGGDLGSVMDTAVNDVSVTIEAGYLMGIVGPVILACTATIDEELNP